MDEKSLVAYLEKHQNTIDKVKKHMLGEIITCAQKISLALKRGNKVLIMGNGGSAADSQHFAAELVGRFLMERKGLPAIALTTDSSILTAVGNDYGFDEVFSRQVEALALPGDVVIGLSTSGNSKNVLQAIVKAKEMECVTVGLLGRDGGAIGKRVDLPLTVAVQDTPHIQEAHVTIIHLLCDMIEKEVFDSGTRV